MLSAAYILADPCRPIVSGLGPFTFSSLDTVTHTVWPGPYTEIDCAAEGPALPPSPHRPPPPCLQSTVAVFSQALPGLRDTGDERIGCAETIAEGERFFSGAAEHVHVML